MTALARWINWAPSTGQEVAQNVRQLLKTAPGTVPLSRALGTPQDLVDTPQSYAGARLQQAVVKAINTYEPRVKVASIQLTATAQGTLAATVTIEPST